MRCKLPPYLKKKMIAPQDLSSFAEVIRGHGQTIATVNGSFDLLHAGHLHIIYEASLQSDILIVALNSDTSIKEYKGESRPIVSLNYRLAMVSALEFVDFVTWFDDPNPINILEMISPDVHVNGADWGEEPIEKDVVLKNGGRLHIVDLVPGLSTSNIVERVYASHSQV